MLVAILKSLSWQKSLKTQSWSLRVLTISFKIVPFFPIFTDGFVLNTGAFLVTIELLGNEDQVKKWRELVLNGKVMGGYGQTELGHGSNVQML